MDVKVIFLLLAYSLAFIVGTGYAISLEFKGRRRLIIRLLTIFTFLLFMSLFFYADSVLNYNFEYLDLDYDGVFDYKYRVIDMHGGTARWSEIFKVEFSYVNSSKIIGTEIYWHLEKKDDSFEPWDFSESFEDWRDSPRVGINNWFDLQGWID